MSVRAIVITIHSILETATNYDLVIRNREPKKLWEWCCPRHQNHSCVQQIDNLKCLAQKVYQYTLVEILRCWIFCERTHTFAAFSEIRTAVRQTWWRYACFLPVVGSIADANHNTWRSWWSCAVSIQTRCVKRQEKRKWLFTKDNNSGSRGCGLEDTRDVCPRRFEDCSPVAMFTLGKALLIVRWQQYRAEHYSIVQVCRSLHGMAACMAVDHKHMVEKTRSLSSYFLLGYKSTFYFCLDAISLCSKPPPFWRTSRRWGRW